MDWRAIKADWRRFGSAAAEKWPRLDAKALEQIAGNRTTLMKVLQDEYNLTLEEAGVEADRWADAVSGQSEDAVSRRRQEE